MCYSSIYIQNHKTNHKQRREEELFACKIYNTEEKNVTIFGIKQLANVFSLYHAKKETYQNLPGEKLPFLFFWIRKEYKNILCGIFQKKMTNKLEMVMYFSKKVICIYYFLTIAIVINSTQLRYLNTKIAPYYGNLLLC